MKTCSYCKKEKCKSEFRKNSRYSDGLRSECKDCSRLQVRQYHARKGFINKLKYRYNLNEEDYLELLKRQDGKCAVCKIKCKLSVDHNHKNGKVRGLLCHKCNSGLGLFSEDIKILEEAIKYIKVNSNETMDSPTLPLTL